MLVIQNQRQKGILIGDVVGNCYQVKKFLGAGGFGETFVVENLRFPGNAKPLYVLKRLKILAAEKSVLLRLFDQEAKVMHELGRRIAKVPKLESYFEENGSFYLVQEYIQGDDLTSNVDFGIQIGRKNTEFQAFWVLAKIAEVMKQIHLAGVIHRDLKPSNVIEKNQGFYPIDYGAVKVVTQGQTRTIAIGTPGYMAPEQAFGHPTFASDVYSIGMMAIASLTGMPPDELIRDSQGVLQWRHLTNITLPAVANLIDQAVCFDPQKRIPNGQELFKKALKINELDLATAIPLHLARAEMVLTLKSRLELNLKPGKKLPIGAQMQSYITCIPLLKRMAETLCSDPSSIHGDRLKSLFNAYWVMTKGRDWPGSSLQQPVN